MVKEVNKKEFEEITKEGKVVVDFFATWCGPCKMLSPVIDQVSEEVSGVTFVKVDVDEEELLAEKFGVVSIPTVVVLENGTEVNRMVGFAPKDKVLDLIK